MSCTFSPLRRKRYRCSCHGAVIKEAKLEVHRSLTSKPRPPKQTARHVVVTSDAVRMTCPCCRNRIPFPGAGRHGCSNCGKTLQIEVRTAGWPSWTPERRGSSRYQSFGIFG